MGRGRVVQIVLVATVVVLLLMNVAQFMLYNGKTTGVAQEDVPMQISDLKEEGWEAMVGKTVTVGGYYVENNGIPLLISDPALLKIRTPMEQAAFIRIETPISNATMLGQYHLKGEITRSANDTEMVYLKNNLADLVLEPANDIIPQYLVHYDITIPPEHSPTKYAVLVSGAYTLVDSRPSFWNDLKLVYMVLIGRNYDPSNIYVLFSNGVGLDDEIPVDYAASRSNVSNVLGQLVHTMTFDDTLLFYATDHGGGYDGNGVEPASDTYGYDEFVALWDYTIYTDDLLNAMLSNIPCKNVIVILDLCDSGGFTWDLRNDNRIIMTACRENEAAVDHPDFPNGDFTYNLFRAFQNLWFLFADKDQNGMVSVAEAFNYAAIASISSQMPTYEDNGDGVPHYGNISNGGVVEDDGKKGLTYL